MNRNRLKKIILDISGDELTDGPEEFEGSGFYEENRIHFLSHQCGCERGFNAGSGREKMEHFPACRADRTSMGRQ